MDKIQSYYVKGKFIVRNKYKQSILNNPVSRHILYFSQTILVFSLLFLKKMIKKNKQNFKYEVALCGMFKNEGIFLNEWIQFHKEIGIDHFYLYNNNSDDNFREVIKPYIDEGIVDLIEWPFEHSQMDAYKDCYQKVKNTTNWLTFIDVDEFICPIATTDIKSWLKSFKNYPGVAVYWKQFGSNGKLTHNEDKLVIEQYTQCWPKPSIFTKMFCNMNFSISEFSNPHIINSSIGKIRVPPVNQFKKIMSFGIHRTGIFNKSDIQINHYWGKAFDCFVKNKVNRSDVFHKNDNEMGQLRKHLLKSHEEMCTTRDYTIQRFLLTTKLKIKD